MSRCDYKDIFGKPGTGAHSIRLFDIAIVDLGMTIITAYFIPKISNKYFGTKWTFLWTLIALLILGHALHVFFCVETTLVKLLTPLK